MSDALRLARAALDDVLAHARSTHPAECCGAVLEIGAQLHIGDRTVESYAACSADCISGR